MFDKKYLISSFVIFANASVTQLNSNIVLQRISFVLEDKSTTNINLQKGIYIFINNHILVNPIQVTFIVVNDAFPVNVTHLIRMIILFLLLNIIVLGNYIY